MKKKKEESNKESNSEEEETEESEGDIIEDFPEDADSVAEELSPDVLEFLETRGGVSAPSLEGVLTEQDGDVIIAAPSRSSVDEGEEEVSYVERKAEQYDADDANKRSYEKNLEKGVGESYIPSEIQARENVESQGFSPIKEEKIKGIVHMPESLEQSREKTRDYVLSEDSIQNPDLDKPFEDKKYKPL